MRNCLYKDDITSEVQKSTIILLNKEFQKNVDILSLCKVGHFGIYKNPNGIICSIVLKKKGENNTTEELSPLSVFSKQEELRIQGSDYRNTSLFTRHQQILSHTRNM